MSAAKKVSKTAVQVGEFVYLFDTEERADLFLACLAKDDVQVCAVEHSALMVPISEYIDENGDDSDDRNDGGGKLRM